MPAPGGSAFSLHEVAPRLLVAVAALFVLFLGSEHLYGPAVTTRDPPADCARGWCRKVKPLNTGARAAVAAAPRSVAGRAPHASRGSRGASPREAAAQARAVPWPTASEAGLWTKLLSARCGVDWGPVVATQLKQWETTGITRQQTDEYCVKKIVRFSLVNDELRVSRFQPANKNNHRLACGFWLIKVAAMRARARGSPLPAVEINMQSGDTSFSLGIPRRQWDNAGPMFGNIKCGDASVSFPLTLHDQFGAGDGTMSLQVYEEKYQQALEWTDGEMALPFKDRVDVAFFSAGGGAILRGNRSQLPKIAKAHPESLNVSTDAKDMPYMAQFKYNVYAYGHCGWSRRIHELAMMNTGVLMEDSPCNEYLHGVFVPGKHYLPVNGDFSDLHDVVQKAKHDGLDVEAMAREWSELGRDSLTLACTLDYVEALLRRVAELQRFAPEYHPEWSEYKLGRNRLWFAGIHARNMSECIGPAWHNTPKKMPC